MMQKPHPPLPTSFLYQRSWRGGGHCCMAGSKALRCEHCAEEAPFDFIHLKCICIISTIGGQ
jgi:hypothetical protein